MDPITALLAALALTRSLRLVADKGLQAIAANLKELLTEKFGADNPRLMWTLEEYVEDPETFARPATKLLSEVGADRDPDVSHLVHNLLRRVEASQPGLTGDVIGRIASVDNVVVIGRDVGNVINISSTSAGIATRTESATPTRQLFAGVPPPNKLFVGRDKELALLRSAIFTADERLGRVAVYGPAGIGKTALAVAFAYDQGTLRRFGGGVLWADLGPQPDLTRVLNRWATSLNVELAPASSPSERLQDLADRLRSAAAGAPFLVVLDDAHDWEAVSPFLEFSVPRSVLLLTTRRASLAQRFSGTRRVALAELSETAALEYLVRTSPGPLAEDRRGLEELARSASGNPFALNLIAALASDPGRSVSWQDIVKEPRSAATKRARTSTKSDVAPRLLATIESILALLPSAADRAAFAQLSVFAPSPADFSRDAALAVWEVEGRRGDNWLRLFQNRSLLMNVGLGRFSLHPVPTQVARSHLAPDSPAAQRHFNHYLQVVNRDRENWAGIEAELLQIRQAWAWVSDAPGRESALLELVWAMRPFMEHRRLWDEQLRWYERALDIARSSGLRVEEATLLNNIGLVHRNLGDLEEAVRAYEEALPLQRELDNRAGTAAIFANLGTIYTHRKDEAAALAAYEQALALYRELGDRAEEARTLHNIGLARGEQRDMAGALAAFEQALALYRELGDRAEEARTLYNIGVARGEQGDEAGALAAYEQALALYRELGDRAGEADSLDVIAVIRRGIERAGTESHPYAQTVPQLANDFGTVSSIPVAAVGNAFLQGATEQSLEPSLGDQALSAAQRFLEQGDNTVHRQGDRRLVIVSSNGRLRPFVPVPVLFVREAPTEHDVTALSGASTQVANGAADRIGILLYGQPPDAAVRLEIARVRLRDHFALIPIPFAEAEQALIDRARSAGTLADYVSRYLPGANLYDNRGSIGDTITFFGRADLLHQLSADLLRGEGIGIFGLRKSGKTSVLLQLAYTLRQQPVVHIDLQPFGGKTRFGADLFNAILRRLTALVSARTPQLAPSHDPFAADTPAGEVSDTFVQRMGVLTDSLVQAGYELPVVCFLDEIERILPGPTNTREQVEEFNASFGALRAFGQSERKLALLVADVHPDCNRINQWPHAGVPTNPVYNFFKEINLQPFTEDHTITMIADIGRLMGRSFDEETLSQIHAASGGHPFLARQLASLLCTQFPTQGEAPLSWTVARRYIERALTYSGILRDYFAQNIWADMEKRNSCAAMDTLRILVCNDATHHWLTDTDLAAKLGDNFTQDQRVVAMQWLVQNGLILRDESAAVDRYRVRVPLLSQWLHMQMTKKEMAAWLIE